MPILEKKDKEKKILELTANIILKSQGVVQISDTPAKIVLDEENLSIFSENWGTYLFSYREVIDVISEDYKLKLSFNKEKELVISQLGYQYEDFTRILIKLRNETILKDLLFQETLKKSGLEADFTYLDEKGVLKQEGKAEFRFYQTSLVILPERGELIKILFSDILETKTDNFQIEITIEKVGKVIILKLGEKFDLFKETLNSCLNESVLNVQNFIKEIWPEIDFSTLNKISGLIKEGKAIEREKIKIIAPEFWEKLEKALMRTEIKEEYEFLKSIGEQEKIYLGFKKGLMGKLTGDYLWFFIPTGNAIAFETTGEKETGRATYFFRILNRNEYKTVDKSQIESQIDNLISKINLGLLAINFRREPIYLSEEKLEEPDYVKYKFSMAKIPEIKLMRDLFIGRVIHRDNEQWQKGVTDLLAFNVNSNDDAEKWSSFEETTEDKQEIDEENKAGDEITDQI
ncbi:MAG: hypothetical protein WC306_00655 [Candidatus Paceibacterota bacterium]|jgi:6-pyruvoyl-tetrahydropterin synthase